ncbi:MAG: SIS domain-containing protein, partial [Candidatus Omnitrophica bacterium]|nr:SIS domain-containing protein [Candidatus Omnitrophota bacterium]
MENTQKIKKILTESAQVNRGLIRHALEIQKIADKMISAAKKGGTIYIIGNGGSAADSQHMAAELIGRFKKERRAIPAVALTTDTSALTAIGNDYGFEQIFS